MPTLEEIVKSEHAMFTLETRIGGIPPYTAINDLEEVCRTPSSLRYRNPTTVKPLKNSAGAFIVTCQSLNTKALWVATSNNAYRSDYLLYLKSEFNLDLDKLPRTYDVDHLYNRERARAYGLIYIRTALVPYPANRSHGAGYEQDITKNEAGRTPKDRKSMDEISNMKYFGFLSPLRSDPRPDEVRAYAAFAASQFGMEAEDVIKSVQYLRDKASKPWARKT